VYVLEVAADGTQDLAGPLYRQPTYLLAEHWRFLRGDITYRVERWSVSFGESVNQLLITDRVEYIPVVMFSLRGCLCGQNCLKLGDISADKISRGMG
jgi:hypothetical protein